MKNNTIKFLSSFILVLNIFCFSLITFTFSYAGVSLDEGYSFEEHYSKVVLNEWSIFFIQFLIVLLTFILVILIRRKKH